MRHSYLVLAFPVAVAVTEAQFDYLRGVITREEAIAKFPDDPVAVRVFDKLNAGDWRWARTDQGFAIFEGVELLPSKVFSSN